MQLSKKNLKRLSSDIIKPDEKVIDAKIGMLHLGLGNFYRAHQCTFTQDAIALSGGDWAYIAATMSSPRVINGLKEQDYLYTHISHSEARTKVQIINIIKDTILVKNEINKFYQYMEDENIVIVTLTITEKGYYFEPSTGDLLINHPDIEADIYALDQPKTAIGVLVQGLQRRKQKNGKGISILSCDNLPDNGKVTQRIILQYAEKTDASLRDWIKKNVTFPSSMVDRITPHVTDEDISWLKEEYEYTDIIPIQTESFSQWIIEDDFPYGRPLWEKSGVEMVSNVKAYEEMKLRLLNGTHSTIAYLGYLSGYKVVDAAIGEPIFAKFIRDMMDKEITPTLDMPKDVNITAYKDALIQRYKNPNLKHSTYQIAMDGSQKIPQRIINSLSHQYKNKGENERLITCLAAWIYYIEAAYKKDATYEVQDPLSENFTTIGKNAKTDTDFIKKILSIDKIFGKFFDDKTDLVEKIIKRNNELKRQGILDILNKINMNGT